ncbi:MAG: TerB N-terminal domain-containing protein [Blautia sp.]|nr:TerB N-terminal domain-containing protein [Blautia sp.]
MQNGRTDLPGRPFEEWEGPRTREQDREENDPGGQHGYTVVLEAEPAPAATVYQDTRLPFDAVPRPVRQEIPEKLRQMRHLYEYGRESMEARAANFYRQGKFMEDFEDEAPWAGEFVCYYPTYHDLTTYQLRGYFSWRTHIRRGDWQPITASAAYIYLYELLNGIGADSPQDSLQKLREFEKGFLDRGFGNARMRQNLNRWMLSFVVVNELSPEEALPYIDHDLLHSDASIAILRTPDSYTDEEVFRALCAFGRAKQEESPVLTADPERGMHLFSEAWRKAAAAYRRKDKDLFTQCFGEQITRRWYPFSNAVYYWQDGRRDRTWQLNECRTYRRRDGVWQVVAYDKLYYDKERLQGFLHEADLLLRRYLKTGRCLREKEADAWAAPYISAAIEEDKRAVIEAARPKITIDLSDLDRIRRDALVTQNSLLVEEELAEAERKEELYGGDVETEGGGSTEAAGRNAETEPAADPDLPLTGIQTRILRALLSGDDADDLVRSAHLMPSIMADEINEAFFDEIGDTVLLCEDDHLSLVEDYIEEIEHILGGT